MFVRLHVCLCVYFVSDPVFSVLLPTYIHVYFLSVCLIPVPRNYICVGQHTHARHTQKRIDVYVHESTELAHNSLWKAAFQTIAHRTVVCIKLTTK